MTVPVGMRSSNDKTKIFSNFVALSENLNFIYLGLGVLSCLGNLLGLCAEAGNVEVFLGLIS